MAKKEKTGYKPPKVPFFRKVVRGRTLLLMCLPAILFFIAFFINGLKNYMKKWITLF